MLQVLLQKACDNAGHDVQVESAGIKESAAGQPAAPDSINFMRERGLDLSDHKSRWIESLDYNSYHFIVAIDNEVMDRLRVLRPQGVVIVANEQHGGVPNPWQKGTEAYRECALTMERCTKEIMEAISDEVLKNIQ